MIRYARSKAQTIPKLIIKIKIVENKFESEPCFKNIIKNDPTEIRMQKQVRAFFKVAI